jgi:hypothetical protein
MSDEKQAKSKAGSGGLASEIANRSSKFENRNSKITRWVDDPIGQSQITNRKSQISNGPIARFSGGHKRT